MLSILFEKSIGMSLWLYIYFFICLICLPCNCVIRFRTSISFIISPFSCTSLQNWPSKIDIHGFFRISCKTSLQSWSQSLSCRLLRFAYLILICWSLSSFFLYTSLKVNLDQFVLSLRELTSCDFIEHVSFFQ